MKYLLVPHTLTFFLSPQNIPCISLGKLISYINIFMLISFDSCYKYINMIYLSFCIVYFYYFCANIVHNYPQGDLLFCVLWLDILMLK